MPPSNFLIAGLTLVLIDLLLAGDNAFVIAMAVRHLPPRERRIASICGAALAVILRVGLTFVAAKILEVRFVKLAGGLFILWIAFQVLRDAGQPQEVEAAPHGLARAIWYVLFADLTMSTDNILAIAGASSGHFGLILFGLAVSIPFIVVSSNLLARLMDRYPIVIYVGAAILGKVGGDMALTDPWVTGLINISDVARYAVDAALIAAILIAGRLAAKKSSNSPA
jgi:YjbE family integral membrane protein